MGKPRRLDAAVGLHSRDLRRARRPVWPRAAAQASRGRARRTGPDQRRLPRLHSLDLEPVRAALARAIRRTRPQSDPAGPWPRNPSPPALSRLCRLLDRLFVRRRGADRRPHRRGLGALREALYACRLELSHAWHRRWLLLGLLHAWLGRLLVLGSGGERLPHAVARRHSLRPFGRGDGEARRAQNLDDLSRHPRLLFLAARHLSRALWRAHFRARLRQRSAPRRFHPRDSRDVHLRFVRALRLAGGGVGPRGRGRAPGAVGAGALVVNNLLLTTACATVLFGTLYPLALEQLTGEKITVGAPFFNLTCGALLLTACFAAPFGFSLAWKRGDLLGVVQRLAFAIVVGAVTAVVAAAWLSGGPIFAPLAMGLGVFVIIGTLIEVVMRAWRPGLTAGVALKRTFGLPLSFFGAALAHLGLGVTLLGLSGLGFGAETIATLHKGVPAIVGPYAVTLDSVGERVGPNYKESIASVTVRSGDTVVAQIEPARRQFAARGMSTTQAGLKTLHFGQIYFSIPAPAADGSVPARLYWKPLVTLIWLGGAAMALGGGLSLADRRLRFGVATRAEAGASLLAQAAQ